MYFTIEKGSGGFFFRVKGENGQIMAHSEIYTAKASAQSAVDVIKAGAKTGAVLDNT